MYQQPAHVLARVERFTRERLVPAIHPRTMGLDLASWDAPGEPVSFADAVAHDFTPIAVGDRWGRPWGTTWLHATGRVPDAWPADAAVELVVDLGFTPTLPGFQAEGLVYTAEGRILKAVEPRNRCVRLPVTRGQSVDLYIEAASNPDIVGNFEFTPTPLGDRATAGDQPLYLLMQVDLAVRDREVWELVQDLRTLVGLANELPTGPRLSDILLALSGCMDALDPDDLSATASAARARLGRELAKPATSSAHRVHAVGHAHIDSAWLWPARETVRKVARTFSNVLALMDEHPQLVFAASSAQQYAWLKDSYPELFDQVRARVAEGRFVPVGGMWVEADTNMPGGEALVRQFMYGKRFFLDEFDLEPLDVWLPDSFGYSAALPQIIRLVGSRWFLTQKLSWNDTNALPHHTLRWEGIDGTRVFTHFPPVSTYSSELSAAELARAEREFREAGPASRSLVPFGWGDGGGGPTEEMLAAADRARSLEGLPTVEVTTPADFFEAAEAEYPAAPVWSGELYLEFHRGTYTSQARTKRGNRFSEQLLREAELWATVAAIRCGEPYPYDELDSLWHTVLLQQFHDILTGTSIQWVHAEAERRYADVAARLETIINAAMAALAPAGSGVFFNAGPYAVRGVPGLGAGIPIAHLPGGSSDPDGGAHSGERGAVRVDRSGGVITVASDRLRLTLDQRGLITSVRDLRADRELVAESSPCNAPLLYRDMPNQWDAWDIDRHDRASARLLAEVDSVHVEERGDQACVRIERSFGASRLTQEITVSAGSTEVGFRTVVDWHETQKLLKVQFPFDVHADRVAAEIQFGHVFRPTHENTSWDAARFESVAHRFIHVSEPAYGVALATRSTYGFDTGRTTKPDGSTTTTVRLSLLRAPLFPDPSADQGEHEFEYALQIGGIAEAVAAGYRLSVPLRPAASQSESGSVNGARPGLDQPAAVVVDPVVRVDNDALVVEAVKLADDRSGDVIVRLYEAFGSRARGTVTCGFDYTGVAETDLLERPIEGRSDFRASAVYAGQEQEQEQEHRQGQENRHVHIEARPFQIVTLRFAR